MVWRQDRKKERGEALLKFTEVSSALFVFGGEEQHGHVKESYSIISEENMTQITAVITIICYTTWKRVQIFDRRAERSM